MTVKLLNSARRSLERKLKKHLVKIQAQKNVNNFIENFNQLCSIIIELLNILGIELILFYFFFQPSGWRKVRNMVQWTPFIQTFKNRKYQWVQLAGHSGNFKAGRNQGTVLKKLCPQEEKCYNQFSNDSLSSYVPEYQGTLILDNKEGKNF